MLGSCLLRYPLLFDVVGDGFLWHPGWRVWLAVGGVFPVDLVVARVLGEDSPNWKVRFVRFAIGIWFLNLSRFSWFLAFILLPRRFSGRLVFPLTLRHYVASQSTVNAREEY